MVLVIAIIMTLAFLGVVLYLKLLERDMRVQSKTLQRLRGQSTNQLLHQELGNPHLQSLIQEINDVLKDSRVQTEDLQRQKKKLQQEITNISHDLKTPLTAAIGYIDLLAQSNLEQHSPQDIQADLQQIQERLFKLNQLVTDFFEFSKAKQQTIDLEPINFLAILEQSIILLYDAFEQEKREIHLQSPNAPIIITANERMLSRICDNLILNAYKHGIGDVSIQVIDEDFHMTVIVENPYEGDPIDVEAIFDEFYTSDISRTKGGSGLGLAIVKEFVLKMNGSIHATTHDAFLTVTVQFPK